jgi:phospholipase/carboxylesterase
VDFPRLPGRNARRSPLIAQPHRFRPGKGDYAATTVLLLHDGGASDTSLEPFGTTLAPGACLLTPRGMRADTVLGTPCFFRPDKRGTPRAADLVESTEDVLALLRLAAPAYGVTSGRVIAVGLAQGASLGASVLIRSPAALVAAVLWRPRRIPVPRVFPDLRGRAVFISSATRGSEAAEASGLARYLAGAGAAVTLLPPTDGELLSLIELADARAWLLSTFPDLVSD